MWYFWSCGQFFIFQQYGSTSTPRTRHSQPSRTGGSHVHFARHVVLQHSRIVTGCSHLLNQNSRSSATASLPDESAWLRWTEASVHPMDACVCKRPWDGLDRTMHHRWLNWWVVRNVWVTCSGQRRTFRAFNTTWQCITKNTNIVWSILQTLEAISASVSVNKIL